MTHFPAVTPSEGSVGGLTCIHSIQAEHRGGLAAQLVLCPHRHVVGSVQVLGGHWARLRTRGSPALQGVFEFGATASHHPVGTSKKKRAQPWKKEWYLCMISNTWDLMHKTFKDCVKRCCFGLFQ